MKLPSDFVYLPRPFYPIRVSVNNVACTSYAITICNHNCTSIAVCGLFDTEYYRGGFPSKIQSFNSIYTSVIKFTC